MDASVTYLARALAEPPAAASLPQVLLALGAAEAHSGKPTGIDHLLQAYETSTDAMSRAAAAKLLTPLLYMTGRGDDATGLVDRAVDELGPSETGHELIATLIATSRMDPSTRPMWKERLSWLAAEADGNVVTQKRVLANLALTEIEEARSADEAASLARSALEGDTLLDLSEHLSHYGNAAVALIVSDHLDEAHRALDVAVREASSAGAVFSFGWASALRSMCTFAEGALLDAEADARAALDVALEHGLHFAVPAAAAHVVNCLMERGALDHAHDLVEGLGLSGDLPPSGQSILLLIARGRLRIRSGSIVDGVEDLLTSGGIGWENDYAIAPWRPAAVEGLLKLDRGAEAQELAGEQLAAARKFGAPRMIGEALRAAGLAQNNSGGLELLRESVSVLENSTSRLEHSRSLFELGAALRRDRQAVAAREPLREAVDIAHGCGATSLEERAHGELLAAGARPRRRALLGVEALTPSERRVARMARDGMSNRDIAEGLFVTVRTVEVHLSHAYSKLGITSREELRGVMPEP